MDCPAATEVFRPRRLLSWCTAAAGLLWLGVLVYLLRFDGVPLKTLLSTLFFVVLFGVSLLYYCRSAIFLDPSGLTYRGVLRSHRLSFRDIRTVQVLGGPITVYSVLGRGPVVRFSSLYGQHERLMELVVQRTGLEPEFC